MALTQTLKLLPLAWPAVPAISSMACSDGPTYANTGARRAIAVARVTGTVADVTGVPLESVRVSVSIPNTFEAGYAGATAVTNRAGQYSIDVERTRQLGQAPNPDTVRVEVSAVRPGGPSGGASLVKAMELLTFGTNLQSPPQHQLNFQLGR